VSSAGTARHTCLQFQKENVFFAVFVEKLYSMFQKIKQKIVTKIASSVRIWGCVFETEYPPEFIISAHAENRFKTRVKCSRRKMMRMTVKAWKSTLTIPRKNYLEYRSRFDKYPKSHFRTFMGYVFVFRLNPIKGCRKEQKILVTVFDPKKNT
jgi:hypothetical protein